MKVVQKKLEELMYLSLIGEYQYMQWNGNETLIAFMGSRPLCFKMAKPLCLTSNKIGSDRLTKERITVFEGKVFSQYPQVQQMLGNEKFNINKRIKLLIETFCNNEIIFSLYQTNINTLNQCGLLDEIQRLGAIHYVDNTRKQIIRKKQKSLNEK